MRSILTFGAAALALAIALPAAAGDKAKTSSDAAPPAADAAAPAAAADPAGAAADTSTAATSSSAGAALSVGLSVKDKTGTTIGQITEVKPDAAGKQVATVKMGTQTFAVDGSSLAVQNGSAVINATQAELQDMIKKAGPQGG
jgi:hypothetical protein